MKDGLRIESEVARDLLAWAKARLGPEASPTRIFEEISVALRDHLGRWIGGDAFDALAGRAALLGRIRSESLKRAEWRPNETPALTGVESDPQAGGEPFASNLVLLTALVELLGRFIGEEMACRLVRDGLIDTPDAAKQNAEDAP